MGGVTIAANGIVHPCLCIAALPNYFPNFYWPKQKRHPAHLTPHMYLRALR
ncbi:uncharacterized protein BBA_03336 [Beauveria bassiana ARSEF 2860]|uniref:Uncharacterized protein n=1 Tax=Beauveria bassiana (strain ARSEF 2860) TaxID=655819 RepID=J5JZM3_BEAB2|nr:uncharacterized protein BBA_03336 [Beauveria bassiana ARSEF 2860]EJP67556.1 hypothetical protein BBA_03336 [Beauveria bassiana ARSEF 2860]